MNYGVAVLTVARATGQAVRGVKRVLGSRWPLTKQVNTGLQFQFFGVTYWSSKSLGLAELAIHLADSTRTHCSHDYALYCVHVGVLV